ncbi:MAG: DUF3567 domain-containing protein [Burkholderiales bacterium]|nr:DUF3567 domain-containing protein [Burkholderiales bacterium]
MQMLYNSDSYAVVQINVPAEPGDLRRGGYEIVDKFARKDIYIEGALAERFQQGVQELVRLHPDGAEPEVFDDYIAGFATLAAQPLIRH